MVAPDGNWADHCLFLPAVPDAREEIELKILIVEDEIVVALSMHDILTDSGHEVLGIVRTAHEAMQLVRTAKPDLAFLNIDLADDVKGTDLARILRVDFDVPSIFVSGSLHEARAAPNVALGYIAKPCSPMLLTKSVELVKALRSGTPLEELHIPAGLTLFEMPADTVS